MENFENSGIKPSSLLDERKVKVRICRSLSFIGEDYIELSLSQFDCNLTYLGRICADNGLTLVMLGYGD